MSDTRELNPLEVAAIFAAAAVTAPIAFGGVLLFVAMLSVGAAGTRPAQR